MISIAATRRLTATHIRATALVAGATFSLPLSVDLRVSVSLKDSVVRIRNCFQQGDSSIELTSSSHVAVVAVGTCDLHPQHYYHTHQGCCV